MSFLSAAGTVSYYVLYPLIILLRIIVAIVLFLAAPIIHLGYSMLYACYWSFQFLARFEVSGEMLVSNIRLLKARKTLYVYFGVAVLVGVLTGTSLHYASKYVRTTLQIESHFEKSHRGLAGYRDARRKRVEGRIQPSASVVIKIHQPKIGGGLEDEYDDWLKQDKTRQNRKGAIPSTILEEDDSSDNGF